MKTSRTVTSIVLCLAISIFVAAAAVTQPGCSIVERVTGSESRVPRQSYAQIQDVFIATAQSLDSARRDGLIDQDFYMETVLPRLEVADALVTQLDNITAAGGELEDSLVQQLQELLTVLRGYLASIEEGGDS